MTETTPKTKRHVACITGNHGQGLHIKHPHTGATQIFPCEMMHEIEIEKEVDGKKEKVKKLSSVFTLPIVVADELIKNNPFAWVDLDEVGVKLPNAPSLDDVIKGGDDQGKIDPVDIRLKRVSENREKIALPYWKEAFSTDIFDQATRNLILKGSKSAKKTYHNALALVKEDKIKAVLDVLEGGLPK